MRTIAITLIIFVFTSVLSAQNYRDLMRNLVIEIADYSEEQHPGFLIIPQNGEELLTRDGRAESLLIRDYLSAIDAIGREELNYGYDYSNRPTRERDRIPMLDLCRLILSEGKPVLVTDYCWNRSKLDMSYSVNQQEGFLSFATHRNLDRIPSYPEEPFNNHHASIDTLYEAENFLFLIDPGKFKTRREYLEALQQSNYDLLIIDLFYEGTLLTPSELVQLRTKPQGGSRLLIAYMSIGEAEDYRYYWQRDWVQNAPSWLQAENPDWEGNYKVKYWDPQWQNVLYGQADAYLDKILKAGFDGVYLDIVDGFAFFEEYGEDFVFPDPELGKQGSSGPTDGTTGASS